MKQMKKTEHVPRPRSGLKKMQWFGKDQIPITKIVMLQNEINNIANFEATDVKVYDFRAV